MVKVRVADAKTALQVEALRRGDRRDQEREDQILEQIVMIRADEVTEGRNAWRTPNHLPRFDLILPLKSRAPCQKLCGEAMMAPPSLPMALTGQGRHQSEKAINTGSRSAF